MNMREALAASKHNLVFLPKNTIIYYARVLRNGDVRMFAERITNMEKNINDRLVHEEQINADIRESVSWEEGWKVLE